MSAYADNLAIARSARKKGVIIASIQLELDNVVAWSAKARLTINASKCETVFFSLSGAEAACQSKNTIDVLRMSCIPLTILMGIRFDRQFNIEKHVRNLLPTEVP